MAQVFDPDRISKISQIMPQFAQVAAVGDTVLMGLEGDPAFPYKRDNRPSAVVSNIEKKHGNIEVTLTMSDGTKKTVGEYTISPSEVWEFTDSSFAKVMERERRQQETQLAKQQEHAESRMQTYRGNSASSLHEEVAMLRAELESERQLTRNFHNTYITSLHELASDVCKLDSTGKCAAFCRTFNAEYEKMQSRAEQSVYRGTRTSSRNDNDEEDDEEEEQDEELMTSSDVDSLSDVERRPMGESDYY